MPAARHTLAVVALGLAPMSALLAQSPTTLRLIPVNGRVAIWNLAGTARIEPGSGSSVEVEVTPRGEDARDLITRTGEIDGAQALRIFHPASDIRMPDDSRRGSHYSTTLRLRDDGRFNLPGNSGRRVRISDDKGAEAAADLVIRVPSSVAVELHLGVGEVAARGSMRNLSIETSSGAVRTADTRGALRIETGSGAVSVATHDGDLSVETGSGSVSASDITDAGSVVLETGSGSMNVLRARATDRLRLETGSGRIVAITVDAAQMSLETGSGSVEVAPASSGGDLRVETGSGSVTLIAPTEFSAEVQATAGSGGVRSDLPIQVTRQERGELRGRIGSGRARVVLETGSGGITLRGARRTSI